MNFEAPLTSLVWLTSIVSVVITYIVSYLLIPDLGRRHAVVEAVDDHHLRHAGRRDHPGVRQGLHLDRIGARARKSSPRRARAAPSLNILSGFVAGNFSAYWLGLSIVALMGIAYCVEPVRASATLMLAPAVFAFGLVAFGFLGMGPVTIAVDSYGPVTDNAQSVFELSVIEQIPGIKEQLKTRLRLRRAASSAPRICSKRTTAPATRSRRRPSRC